MHHVRVPYRLAVHGCLCLQMMCVLLMVISAGGFSCRKCQCLPGWIFTTSVRNGQTLNYSFNIVQAPFPRTPQQGPRGPRGGFAPGPFGPPQNFVMVGPGGRAYPGPGGRGPRGPRMNGPQYGAMQVCVAAAPYPSLLVLSLHACF